MPANAEPILVEWIDPEDNYLEAYFQDACDSGDFKDALDTDVSVHHDRAVIDWITITDVEVKDNGDVNVHYEVEYSWYLGCSDMDGADRMEDCVAGIKDGEFWRFERFVPQERRSTHEEF